MFIHKIITPMFIRRFECVGSECLSHCCQDWFISIDKKTYKNITVRTALKLSRFLRSMFLNQSVPVHMRISG